MLVASSMREAAKGARQRPSAAGSANEQCDIALRATGISAMAKCFMAGLNLEAEGARMYGKGKEFVPGTHRDMFGRLHNGRGYHKTTVINGKDRETLDLGVRESLSGVKTYLADKGIQEPKLHIGDTNSWWYRKALYVLGSRDSILNVFRQADNTPEIVISPTLYIGVAKWGHLMGEDRYCVRIKTMGSGKPDLRQNTKKPHFYDIDVTEQMQCIVKAVTVHPLAFVLPIKNVLDRG